MIEPFEELMARGVFAPIDVRFAQAMRRLEPEAHPHVVMAAALASRAVQQGHVCLDLSRVAGKPLIDDDGRAVDTPLPGLSHTLAELEQSALVGDENPEAETPPTPLVRAGTRLYLARYHGYEQRLARALRARAESVVDVAPRALRAGLDRLFPDAPPGDAQRRAAAVAVRRRLAIISGGPGTGKTTTVAKILTLLQEEAHRRNRPWLRIALVAPTGKAAQRLGAAIGASLDALDTDDAVRQAVPRTAKTIHRTLGHRTHAPTSFAHGRGRPLDVDVVLADEASMIDLALMTKLAEAVPAEGRLILLGDKDQLVSVEAGAIFGDLHGEAEGYTPPMAAMLREVTGDVEVLEDATADALADSSVRLVKSHRYRADSGIAALARAINEGDADGSVDVLRAGGDVAIVASSGPASAFSRRDARWTDAIVEGFREVYAEGATPEQRLRALERSRVLCAHRRGPGGVEELNAAIAHHLRASGLLTTGTSPFFLGRPILVTRNDHQLGLFNGDVGLVVAGGGGRPAVAFLGDSGVRMVSLARLPAHETVFAMTVHKSQGSEFERVVFVLPPRASPVLTRELLYTAVTRAKRRVDVFGAESVWREAVRTRVQRSSGLAVRLGRA
ncbi:MAG: exodeoxyribonuclease V subunit alpha [Myxococcota bacterium]